MCNVLSKYLKNLSLLIQVASFKIVYKKITNYFLNNYNDILITCSKLILFDPHTFLVNNYPSLTKYFAFLVSPINIFFVSFSFP